MADTLKLEIVTPSAIVYSEDVSMVALPGRQGDMGIYPNHVPLMTKVAAGEVEVTRGGQKELLAVGEGFAEVTADRVSILTDMAAQEAEIDEAKAEEALKAAEDRLKGENLSDEQVLAAEAAAAAAFQTPEESIEVRLGDKRLVLPDCLDDFGISFPFNDRVTTQMDCMDPKWRGFVQIRLGSGVDVFRYNIALRAGETLKRSHVTRHTVSGSVAASNPIVVLEDVLGLALVQAVTIDEVLLESHFSGSGTLEQTSSSVRPRKLGAGWRRKSFREGAG